MSFNSRECVDTGFVIYYKPAQPMYIGTYNRKNSYRHNNCVVASLNEIRDEAIFVSTQS